MVETPKRLLFVCIANIDRSKTGEAIWKDLLKDRGYTVGTLEEKIGSDFYVGSAGVQANQYGNQDSIQYSEELGSCADTILAMDDEAISEINLQDNRNWTKVVKMYVPNVYKASDEQQYRELVAVFKEKLKPYLPKDKN